MTNLDIIRDDIEWLFDGSFTGERSDEITIAGKKYLEALNYSFLIHRNDIPTLVCQQYLPNTPLDVEERNDIFSFFENYDFVTDPNTRQAAMQPKYKEDSNKPACIPLIHVLLRQGKVYINVYMRSSNYDNNFWYDMQTFAMLMNRLMNIHVAEFGSIYVTIGSLHKLHYSEFEQINQKSI